MRPAVTLLAVSLGWVAGVGPLAAAPQPSPRPGGGPERAAPANPSANGDSRRASSLDDLFSRLSAAGDEDEANGVARLIERRLDRSGSDTADLLATRAGEALQGDDPALAVELLDRVTQLRPDWAEGWNRRAVAFAQLEDPGQAILDLQQALGREPRHFLAWQALGHLELQSGDKKLALVAYRHALAIHPFLKGARQMVDRLAPEVDGRDI